MDWQPIGTAPDNEDVLLCIPRYGVDYPGNPLPPEMSVGKKLSDGEWYSDGFDPKPEYHLHPPTYWMPLPEPPR